MSCSGRYDYFSEKESGGLCDNSNSVGTDPKFTCVCMDASGLHAVCVAEVVCV